MKSLSWLGLAVVALVATRCASGNYNSGTPSHNTGVVDFSGEWRLISGRSDNGGDWNDERSSFGSGWGDTSGANDRMAYGAWFLPDQFVMDVQGGLMSLADINGQPLASIDLGNGYQYGTHSGPADERARWIDARRFEIDRVGRDGRRILQTFTLEGHASELVVVTRVDHNGRSRTYTRMFQRV